MKRIIFALISLCVGLILFFWLFNQVGWRQIRDVLFQLSLLEVLFLLFLSFVSMTLGALRWREILKSKGYNFSLKELFGHCLVSFSLTYLAPLVFLGGEFFKGYALNSREENSTSLEKGMASSLIDGFFNHGFEWFVITLGLFFCFLLVDIPIKNSQILWVLFLLPIGILFSWFFLLRRVGFLRTTFGLKENNQIEIIEKEIFSFFKLKNKAFQEALFLSFVNVLLRFFQYWFLVKFLGKSISFSAAVSVFGMSVLFMAPPVSADLGTHDWGSAFLFEKLGIGQEVGLAFASIVRVLNLILAILGIGYLIKFGFSNLIKKILHIIGNVSFNNGFDTSENEKQGNSPRTNFLKK